MANQKTSAAPTPPPVTKDSEAFARAFTEWDRRYREDPEGFESEAVHLLKGSPKTYGEFAAPYFMSILEHLRREP